MDKNERDLRELVFGDELARTPDAELQAISERPESQRELNRLLELREALLSLEEEEPPRRTVLVDALPATDLPWWKRMALFGSPAWGFAGALVLALAVLAHGWMARPLTNGPASNELVAQAPAALSREPDADAVNARIDAAVERRLTAAITRVKAELRQEHERETKRLVSAAEQRLEREHDNEMYQMREAVAFIQKKYGRQMVANVAFMGERQ